MPGRYKRVLASHVDLNKPENKESNLNSTIGYFINWTFHESKKLVVVFQVPSRGPEFTGENLFLPEVGKNTKGANYSTGDMHKIVLSLITSLKGCLNYSVC